MKRTVTCPKCNEEIGIIPIIIAITPFSFKCDKCKTRIYIKDIIFLIISLMVVFGMAAVLFLQAFLQSDKSQEYIYLLIPLFIIVLLEIITALVVCNKGRLVVREKKSKDG